MMVDDDWRPRRPVDPSLAAALDALEADVAELLAVPLPGEVAHILRDGDDYRDRRPHHRCPHACCGYAVVNDYQDHSHQHEPSQCPSCQRAT